MSLPTEPATLEGKRPIADELMLLRRAINAVETRLYEHMATADTAYPNADRRKHHDHHTDINQKESDRREFWKKVIPQLIGGILLALLGFMGAALLFFVRFGGAK